MYGGEGGGYCHVSQIYERQQFEVVKGDFWLECLTIFATGCSLHNDLPGILLRFREKYVALSGDVSDMFCHVRLRQEDCKYHRYLWRDMDTKRRLRDELPSVRRQVITL